jgi:hypothetical protein
MKLSEPAPFTLPSRLSLLLGGFVCLLIAVIFTLLIVELTRAPENVRQSKSLVAVEPALLIL